MFLMTKREHWKAAIAQAYGGREEFELHELTDISQPWLNQIKNGRIPSREFLRRICDLPGVARRTRAALFYLAGYVDPAAESDAALMAGVRELQQEYGDFGVSTTDLPVAGASLEEVERFLADLRDKTCTGGPACSCPP